LLIEKKDYPNRSIPQDGKRLDLNVAYPLSYDIWKKIPPPLKNKNQNIFSIFFSFYIDSHLKITLTNY